MNNKPVAWMNSKGDIILPAHQENKEYNIPLYPHPAEEKDKSFVTHKTKLNVEELLEVLKDIDFVTDNFNDFAKAISKKEQEK
jgi:hypothetical protein